jgi:hypothetical protein
VAKRKKKDSQAFVLVRLGWEERDDRAFSRVLWEDNTERELGRPVAVFTDRESAEARKEHLEREERESLDPFTFLGPDDSYLEEVSSLNADVFAARLKELVPKARLPRAGKYSDRDWAGWWAKHADALSEEQRQAVWGLLDKLEFYHVLPTEVE